MQKDKLKIMRSIGLFFTGLGSIIVTGAYAYGLPGYFTVIGIVIFSNGIFYFGKSEVIRCKKHLKS